MLESVFDKVAGLIKNRLQHRYFPVNIVKFLGTAFSGTPVKATLKKFTKFTGKCPCQCFFFIMLQAYDTKTQVLSSEFSEMFLNNLFCRALVNDYP